ncbi:MAG: CBASS cGAMP-activated phospholipase [Nitriliruptor sp.]
MGSADQRFQILALDGGGVKALFTAHLLAHLEDDLDVDIRDCFDLFAGTSAGGIVALALGAGLRPAEIVEHYANLVEVVFPRGRRRWHHLPRRMVRPTYSAEPLRDALAAVLGDRLLGDSERRLIVPAWDVQRGCVHIFKTPHDERYKRDWKVPMVDVAMATSAAPTFLPAANVNAQRLIDGGVWANNPSPVAIAEAVSTLQIPLHAIRVLNVGTTDEVADHPSKLDEGGLGSWAKHVTGLVITASSRGNQGLAQHLLADGNYQRFDAHVAKGRYRLDAADPGELAAIASSEARRLGPTFTETFADHVAAPYQPLHSRSVRKDVA